MDKYFKVAIKFDNKCGFVEYSAEGENIKVVLDDLEKRGEIEKYLSEEHIIRVAGKSLLDFSEKTVRPSEDVDSFKTALTRMWENTGVMVDWSRPV